MTTHHAPRISVIVPSYNQGAYIESTILSVLQQDVADWELIIQDSCSKDQTATVCRAYESVDPRIRFYSEKDKGFADAVNRALDKATGTFACIQSSDDYFSSPTVFREALDAFDRHPTAYLVSGLHLFVDQEHRQVHCPPPYPDPTPGFVDPVSVFYLRNHFPQSSTFFRVDRARTAGPLRLDVDMVADTDFWIRMAVTRPLHTSGIYRCDRTWSCVLLHPEQRSASQGPFYLGRARMYRDFLKQEQLELTAEQKMQAFRSNLIDALDYFLSQSLDPSPLADLYREVTGHPLPLVWQLKSVAFRSSLLRRLWYKGQTDRSSLTLLNYPRGERFDWFASFRKF
jgi:glycosyltransferase involved in cell wall biosynthesis